MVRMFYTSADHEMWKNDSSLMEVLSVAIHSHHCDLLFVPVYNSFVNVTTKVVDESDAVELDSFKWTSHIGTGKGGFKRNGKVNLSPLDNQECTPGGPFWMLAGDLHTVFVEKGKEAAWIIFEGSEDKDYDSSSFSNDDLEKFSPEGFYKEMPTDMARDILKKTIDFS